VPKEKVMQHELDKLNQKSGKDNTSRPHLNWKGELLLAILPTLTMLAVLALMEVLSHQRVLLCFAGFQCFLNLS